jgi:four helix bundle protein
LGFFWKKHDGFPIVNVEIATTFQKKMFLKLNHQELDIYKVSKRPVIEIYKSSKKLPSEENYALRSQIRRAVVSVFLNISEGASRISQKEEKRFYEISRSSLVELDAALEVSVELNYYSIEELKENGDLIIRCFQMLTKLIEKKK